MTPTALDIKPARPPYDPESEVAAVAVGGGVLLTQAFALFPGLLPCLVLLLPFVLPVVVLGLVGAVLVGVPLGLWRLAGRMAQSLRRPHSLDGAVEVHSTAS